MIKPKINIPLARNIDSVVFTELFLANAIFSVLSIRFFLYITGYPQLSGERLHIAHMLWGGLFMLISISFALGLIGRGRLFIATTLGGLGFGAFIDELGKFITTDNDYFFRPTTALIYLIFICLFFIYRYLFKNRPLTPKEYLSNASELLTEMIITEDYDEQDKQKLQTLLYQANATKSVQQSFFQLVDNFKTDRATYPSLYSRLKEHLENLYKQIVQSSIFPTILKGFFVFYAVSIILNLLFELFTLYEKKLIFNFGNSTFFEFGIILSSLSVVICIFWGLITYKESESDALSWFKTSILIVIFFYTFFSFYFNQFLTILGLFLALLVLYALEIMRTMEESKK